MYGLGFTVLGFMILGRFRFRHGFTLVNSSLAERFLTCSRQGFTLVNSSLAEKFLTCFRQGLTGEFFLGREVTMWCITTSGLWLRMFKAILPNLSIKVLRDSSFSCRIFTKAMEVRWCGQLVVKCAPNFVVSVSKQSMD